MNTSILNLIAEIKSPANGDAPIGFFKMGFTNDSRKNSENVNVSIQESHLSAQVVKA